MESFLRLGLAEPLAAAMASFGFEGPTPIQALAIPLLLARRDAFLEAETGTGKTFAYLAPAFQSLFSQVSAKRGSGEPGLLVIAPTQELAVQIGRESRRLALAASLPLKTVVLLAGTPLDKLAAKLRERPDVVIGTPGRLGDLASLGKLKLSSLHYLVLDEADRLLAPETEVRTLSLLKAAPEGCARVLVSATIPERARQIARPLMRDPAQPRAGGASALPGSIEHWCFYCDGRKRLDFVRRLEAAIAPERCLVFISSARLVEPAARRLAAAGLPIEGIHAGMDKEERRVALERFASGELRYLITSDLGARGLDVASISHVLSLDLPEEPTVYTHRAGRTGRAGASGVSIVLADGVELARASRIAVRGGFVFRCKVLERGTVLEPTSEEFFALARAAEEERLAARASRAGSDERRRPEGAEPRRERRSPVARRVEDRGRFSSPPPGGPPRLGPSAAGGPKKAGKAPQPPAPRAGRFAGQGSVGPARDGIKRGDRVGGKRDDRHRGERDSRERGDADPARGGARRGERTSHDRQHADRRRTGPDTRRPNGARRGP